MTAALLLALLAAPPLDARAVLRHSGCQGCHDSAVNTEHSDALEQFDLNDPKWSDGMTDRALPVLLERMEGRPKESLEIVRNWIDKELKERHPTIAAAAAGDWWVLQSFHESGPLRQEWRVEKADKDTVTFAVHYSRVSPPRTVTKARTSQAIALFDINPPPAAIAKPVPCTIAGKEMTCRQLSFKDGQAVETLLLSDAVKGGIVSLHVAAGFGSSGTNLVGWGHGDTVEFGERY